MKKKLKIILISFAAAVFAVGIILSVYATAVQFAPIKITIDDTKKYQTMEGFGMSACWTFQDIGKDENASKEAASLLYGDDGLRLEVFRYNIGAGTKEIENTYADNRATESFFVSEKYVSAQSFSDPQNYDFTKDRTAQLALDECLKTGNIKQIVLFANSPHYLLTANGKGHADEEYQNNLPKENYGAFADYLIIIADYFADKLSALDAPPKIYLSPVNEPQWKWGGSKKNQEGCHFDPAPLAEFYDVFYTKLSAYNSNHNIKIYPDFFESGSYLSKSDYKKYIAEMKKYSYYDELEHLSVHSYNADDKASGRRKFASYIDENLGGKKIHMSEYCVMKSGVSKKIDAGLYTASVVMKDLTMLSATQWCWWLGASDGDYEDGLVYYGYADGEIEYSRTKRYYAMAQFTRYISSGDVRIKASSKDLLNFNGTECCAYLKPDGSLVFVFINHRKFSRKLKLPKGYNVMSAICTDGDRSLENLDVDGSFTVPAKSITTAILAKN